MTKMKLVHGSLFSGFDAPSIAASWMGWKNAFHCEINPFCNEILKYWFPDSEHYEDITKTDFRQWRGRIDILTGGFPCQPFSLAGQRKGADDNRYLWPHMLRAIREIRPTWVIGENVAGILTMVQPGEETEVGSQTSLFGEDNRKRILLRQEYVVETICKDLEREGYSVQPLLIPACAVGAPHRRDRVWLVAHCADSRTEDVRREREDKVLSDGIAPDTNGYGYLSSGTCEESERCRCGNDGESEKRKQSPEWSNGLHGFPRNASDPNGERCNNRSDNWKERPFYYDWKRYSEESQSEWNKRKCGTCKNSSTTSDSQCSGSGQIQQKIQSEQPNGYCIDSNGSKRTVADSYKFNGNLPRFRSGRISQFEASRLRIDPNTYCELPSQRMLQGEKGRYKQKIRTESLHSRSNWENFPTQSPVCRGNDGLPFDVDNLTIPFTKWRQESVKGYGNAIVPQVILEIFKAIEELDN